MKNSILTKLRRPLALVLMLCMLASLAGCRRKDEPNGTDGITPPESTGAPTQAPTDSKPAEPSTAPTNPTTEAPTTAPEDDTILATVTVSKLNIRKGPATGYPQNGSYVKDDRIEILEIKDGWGRTNKGWVNMEFVKTDKDIAGQDTPTETTGKDTQTDNTKPEKPTDTKSETVTDGNTKALGYGVVNLGALNVRTGPGTKYDAISTVSLGNRYAYYQKSGNWVRIKDGWISVSYFYLEGTTGDGAGTGTVDGSDLNIRKGPDTKYDRVGGLKAGETVKILAQVNGWGYTSKGWVSMKYIKMEGSSTGTVGKGTITASELNIRKEAKKDSEKVGTYVKGDKVEILEVKNGWGRTNKGWISLTYVKMDTTTKTGTVTATSLYIRKSADKNSEAVGSYNKGDKVEILEVSGKWGRTNKGWISLDYVKMD